MRRRKYDKIADEISEKIVKNVLAAGSLLPSQHELVKTYGVSRSCIQRVINLLDERGLIERRPGKGMFVAGDDVSAPTDNLSVVCLLPAGMRLLADSYDNYGIRAMLGAEEAARHSRIGFMLRRLAEHEFDKVIPIIRELKCDGVLVAENLPGNVEGMLVASGVPVVVYGRQGTAARASSIVPNYYDAYYQLFAGMAEDGRKQVGVFYYGTHHYGDDIRSACERVSHGNSDFRVIQYDYSQGKPYHAEDEIELLRQALAAAIASGQLPDVLCFPSDWCAKEAIHILQQQGIKVPGDVDVIGALGLEFGVHFKPELTTLVIEPEELGRRSIDVLKKIITGRSTCITERVPFDYLERSTFKFSSRKKA